MTQQHIYKRRTLKREVHMKGIGLHSGERVCLNLIPAAAGHGLKIRSAKNDASRGSLIDVSPRSVTTTENAVTLTNGVWQIQTVEHILAALATHQITDLIIEVDSEEMPVMDGSGQPFALAIVDAGIHEYAASIEPIRINMPVWVVQGEKYLVALPHNGLRVTYTIDFPHPKLQGQSLSIDLDPETLHKDILPARTFGFLDDVEAMKSRGLIKGASTDNALVLTKRGFYNRPRVDGECIRHKVLDLIGDLYLLGRPLEGHFIAHKAGHALDVALGNNILDQFQSDELAVRRQNDNRLAAKMHGIL
ncbi:MAG: UDP-3-O-[3-hydroxymyristoyl] N-acetylglucosamine deacetylase [Leptospiraceae bacterium]|nr:UDP-3-O-[3-hydroxymyristoyl] N-acetylglucosamine deacetylase [Leptospiraceae bacterium]